MTRQQHRPRSLPAAAILRLAAAWLLLLPVTVPAGLSHELAWYADNGSIPLPELSDEELDDLSEGEPVVWMAEPEVDANGETAGMGIVGLHVIDTPRLLVWLSVLGGNYERDSRLTAVMLDRDDAGAFTRYQHIDLPWPVRDRHWIIRSTKNTALAAASDGVAWEHRWSLHPQGTRLLGELFAGEGVAGLDKDTPQETIYLPANQGAWALIELDRDRTLVVGYLDVDLGGRFPRTLVRTFASRQLKKGLLRLGEMSRRVHLSYRAEPPIHDGNGTAIATGAARAAAADWARAHGPAVLAED